MAGLKLNAFTMFSGNFVSMKSVKNESDTKEAIRPAVLPILKVTKRTRTTIHNNPPK